MEEYEDGNVEEDFAELMGGSDHLAHPTSAQVSQRHGLQRSVEDDGVVEVVREGDRGSNSGYPGAPGSDETRLLSSTMTDESTVRGGAAPIDFFHSTVLINIVNFTLWSSTLMLPALYNALVKDFNLGPRHLAAVPLVRGLVQYLLAPLFGYISDCYSRRRLMCIGTLWWGITTLFIGGATTFDELMVASALNGLGLATIVPVSYSLLCDAFTVENRGKAFGWLGFSSVSGAIAGVMFPTIIESIKWSNDVSPWRICMYSLGVFVMILSIVVLLVIKNPPRSENVGVNLGHVRKIFSNKTYLIVMSGGVFSSLSWDVFSFLILWLQCMGMDTVQSGIAFSSCALGAALGSLFGGFCGDWAARWDPTKGRIIVGQISVFLGIPFAVVFFGEIPRSPEYLWLFSIVGFCFGFAISWPQSACNLPILSEVVPHAALGTAYAIDRMIEGGAAAVGSLVLGILARHYGYIGGDSCSAGRSAAELAPMADAIASALMLVMIVPWTLCFFFYFFLYITYAHDRQPDWHFSTL